MFSPDPERVREDWSYLSYHLATHGIPSNVDEGVSDNTENDPWAPADGVETVVVELAKDDAGRLAEMIREHLPHRPCSSDG